MDVEPTSTATLTRPTPSVEHDNGARVVESLGGAVHTAQCLSNGYLTGARRCDCRVPEYVVEAAWRRELERGSTRSEGFFRLTWRDGQWLAYGLPNGSVRGVYCPAHAADRDERAFASITRSDGPAPAPQPRATS
jgi:hypothetical protein